MSKHWIIHDLKPEQEVGDIFDEKYKAISLLSNTFSRLLDCRNSSFYPYMVLYNECLDHKVDNWEVYEETTKKK